MITELMIDQLIQTRQRAHPGCMVCSRENRKGLQLNFVFCDDGSVSADFNLGRVFEGYPAMLHGGILCAILDGAMTNCLFAHDCVAVTADFHVRFRHPVVTDHAAHVRAWINRSTSGLYELRAEILQNGKLKTTATGKFIQQVHLDGKLKT